MKKMLTPEEFKEQNPDAAAAAIAAHTLQYETVGHGFNETQDSVERFKRTPGARGGYV